MSGFLCAMSGGYRFLIVAACGLSLLCAAGFGAYYAALYGPVEKQYQALDASQSTGEPCQGVTKSPPDIALIPEPVERAIASPPPKSDQDRERRDLFAQESMAVWAFYMTLFAAVSTVITFIGTILIWKQVSLTRKAVEDSSLATAAMGEANDIARTQALAASAALKSQLRPYVARKTVMFEPEMDGEVIRRAVLYIKWTNFGQTVATDVHLNLEAVKMRPGDALPDIPDAGEPDDVPMIIGPDQSHNGEKYFYTAEEYEDFCAGRLSIFIHGIALYSGMKFADDQWRTEWCSILSADGTQIIDGKLAPCLLATNVREENNFMT